jgi:hypothetical protein
LVDLFERMLCCAVVFGFKASIQTSWVPEGDPLVGVVFRKNRVTHFAFWMKQRFWLACRRFPVRFLALTPVLCFPQFWGSAERAAEINSWPPHSTSWPCLFSVISPFNVIRFLCHRLTKRYFIELTAHVTITICYSVMLLLHALASTGHSQRGCSQRNTI